MASDLSAADLPFLATLARSPRPADRAAVVARRDRLLPRRPVPTRAHGARFAAALAERLGDADDATRLAVARKLAPCAEAADVLATLESLGGEAALHVLQCAAALPRERLLAAARATMRARARWRGATISTPNSSPCSPTHGEIEVLIALARNRRAPIDAAALCRARPPRQTAHRRARGSTAGRGVARTRAGAPGQAALFLEADSARRAEIMAAAQRATLGRAANPARRATPRRRSRELERFALDAEPERFVGALAQALECSARTRRPDRPRFLRRAARGRARRARRARRRRGAHPDFARSAGRRRLPPRRRPGASEGRPQPGGRRLWSWRR